PTFLTDIHLVCTRRDAENYFVRLEAAGGGIDEALADMRHRAADGIRPPAFILNETVAQMRRFTAPEPAQNVLSASFTARLEKVADLNLAQRSAMAANATRLVADSVYPAYRRAMEGLSTIQTKATDEAGLWRLPR